MGRGPKIYEGFLSWTREGNAVDGELVLERPDGKFVTITDNLTWIDLDTGVGEVTCEDVHGSPILDMDALRRCLSDGADVTEVHRRVFKTVTYHYVGKLRFYPGENSGITGRRNVQVKLPMIMMPAHKRRYPKWWEHRLK